MITLETESYRRVLPAYSLILLTAAVSPLQLGGAMAALLLLLFSSALISGSEVAFFSLSLNDFARLSEEGTPAARRILKLKEKPRTLLATILISNNFINIAIVIVSDFILRHTLGEGVLERWAAWLIDRLALSTSVVQMASALNFVLTVVGVTFLLVLFGEVAPKIYARINNLQMARFMSGPLMVLMRLFAPLSALLVNGTRVIEHRLARHHRSTPLASREEIDQAIDLTVSRESDAHQEIEMLKRIVKFSEVSVRQIMKPRPDIVAIELHTPYGEVLAKIKESGYSRLPVYEEDLDHIVGILYAKDLIGHLDAAADFRWQRLVRRDNLLFVPETKKINELLKEFQQRHMHMAIVVDEYGGTAGLVTLEDVMEEVIGEIRDEFDEEEEESFYVKIDERTWEFEGKAMLHDVARVLGVDPDIFEKDRGEADSLAGLILELLGYIPDAGKEVIWKGYRIKVIDSDKRQIRKIRITLPEGRPVENTQKASK